VRAWKGHRDRPLKPPGAPYHRAANGIVVNPQAKFD
jgi:hypothetical protein